jgi:O-antigen/teichoic acid export membrane protein
MSSSHRIVRGIAERKVGLGDRAWASDAARPPAGGAPLIDNGGHVPAATAGDLARGRDTASIVTSSFVATVVRGAAGVFVLQVVGAGLTYAFQVAFARWLGIRQFGIYTYVVAWSILLGLPAGLGFPLSVLRFVPEYRVRHDIARLRGLWRAATVLTVVAGGAIAVGAGSVALTVMRRYVGHDAALVTAGALLIPVGALLNLFAAMARARGGVVTAYGPMLIVRPILVLVAGAAVVTGQASFTALDGILMMLGATALVAVLQASIVTQSLRPELGRVQRVYDWRTWLRVSLPLLVVTTFVIALVQTDLLVVGAIRGVSAAAVYSAASKTANLVGYVLIAVTAVTAPLFAELYVRGDRDGLQRLTALAAQWVFWPTILIASILAGAGPLVLSLFGPAFVHGWPVLLFLLCGQVVNASFGPVGYLLSVTGHQDDLAKAYGVVAVLNVGLCLVGALFSGVTGAAAGSAVSVAVANVWLHALTKRRIGIRASIVSSFSVLGVGTNEVGKLSRDHGS